MSTEITLEINKIKEKLISYTHTMRAKERIAHLQPMLVEAEVRNALRETTEARSVVEAYGMPPFTSFDDMDEIIKTADQGGCLTPEQLLFAAETLTAAARLKQYLERAKSLQISLPYYEENLDARDDIREEVARVIRGGRVDDYATKNLKSIRDEIEKMSSKARELADQLLRKYASFMSDNFSTNKSGHICLPVKKEYRNKIPGSIIEKSQSGNTLFIEPIQSAKYAESIYIKKLEEENEVSMILYMLTSMIADAQEVFGKNKETFEKLDFLFAKGALSLEITGIEPEITTDRRISITDGRHPLMNLESAVPLNFKLGGDIRGIIITGPNTGGKTVAIKTVGISCYMAQCGLHIAARKACICMTNRILCDIGDGQSITENLSTFSAHIKNALDIIRLADDESLVIMDELGSGTDPTEGMGIAVAILKELLRLDVMFLVTTHYPEVKTFAEQEAHVENARMLFDKESLKPLYQLELGKAGESCAFHIAKKLGMPADMLYLAETAAYGKSNKARNEKQKQSLNQSREQSREQNRDQRRRIVRKKPTVIKQPTDTYRMGDSVIVFPEKVTGIIYKAADEQGNWVVQIKGRKQSINHKRLRLQVSAAEMYPPDYDFSIVFDSVENRKARHDMDRKYSPDKVITYDEQL